MRSAEISLSKTSSVTTEGVQLTVAGGYFEPKSLKTAYGGVTIVSTQPVIELNNQGQVLRFSLQKDRYQLGRDRRWSDLDIPEKGWEVLSRHQAVFRKEGEDYRIYDGDGHNPSRNGIFLHQARINALKGHLLKHGMTFAIGQDPSNQILLTYFNPEELNLVTKVWR